MKGTYLNYGLFVQIGWSTQTINENKIVLVSPNKMFNFYYIDIAIYVTRMHSAALLPERDRVNYDDNDTLHPCYTQSFSYDYYLEHSINFCNAYSVSRLRLSILIRKIWGYIRFNILLLLALLWHPQQ